LSRVPVFLFSFYVFEHEFILRQVNIVRKHFRVFLIELNDSRHSIDSFLMSIIPLQEFAYIIKDKVVFKHTYYVTRFIVDYIIDDFNIVIGSACKILLFQILSLHIRGLKVNGVLLLKFIDAFISDLIA
jgi:hypothetical protein